MITDNLNPNYVKSVLVNYCFEERQEIKVSVYDVDNFDPKVSVEQTLIGSVIFRMDQLLYAPNKTLNLPIEQDKSNGEENKSGNVVIRGNERKRGTRTHYNFALTASGFKSPLIFYRLSKMLPSGEFVGIYESETARIASDKLHKFKKTEIFSSDLIEDNESQPALIEVFQW